MTLLSSFSISLLLIFLGLSCTHATSPNPVAKPAEEVATDCSSKPVCTMELAPQICSFAGKSFEANNRCQALNLVRTYACEQKLVFAEDKVDCKPHPTLQVEGAGPCGRRMLCPREYEPHICTIGTQKIKGPSQCEALNRAREYACEKGIKFVAEEVKCEMEPKLPKKK